MLSMDNLLPTVSIRFMWNFSCFHLLKYLVNVVLGIFPLFQLVLSHFDDGEAMKVLPDFLITCLSSLKKAESCK